MVDQNLVCVCRQFRDFKRPVLLPWAQYVGRDHTAGNEAERPPLFAYGSILPAAEIHLYHPLVRTLGKSGGSI